MNRFWTAVLLLVPACAARVPWSGAGARAASAVARGDAAAMARSLADLLLRYNLPVAIPDGLVARADAAASGLGAALALAPRDARVSSLVLLLVAREIALLAQRDHLPPDRLESGSVAAEVASALVHALTRRAPDLARGLAAAMGALERLPTPLRARVAAALWELRDRFRARGVPPLMRILSRVFPSAFDRRAVVVLRATRRARLCTVRSVEAPEGTLAAVSPDGRLYLASPRAMREVPATGPERRVGLPARLGPGRLLHHDGRLVHVAAGREGLAVTSVALTAGEARRTGVVEVRGSGFLEDAAALSEGSLLAFRSAFPGYQTVRIELPARRAKTEGALPGAPGYRDGPLGKARFTPGPSARLPRGALVFFDPTAGALRLLERGWVATLAAGGGSRDGEGETASVGRVVAAAAADDDRVFLAEVGAASTGSQRFHLRLLSLSGRPCTGTGAP